jgi:hypothetical protein
MIRAHCDCDFIYGLYCINTEMILAFKFQFIATKKYAVYTVLQNLFTLYGIANGTP